MVVQRENQILKEENNLLRDALLKKIGEPVGQEVLLEVLNLQRQRINNLE